MTPACIAYIKVNFYILWRDEPLTALSCCCAKWTKATTPIAVAQVVANVIWDARDMLAMFVYVKSSCGNSPTIRDQIWKLGPGATRWTSRQGRGRWWQLHHRPLRNDDRAIKHPLHTCTAHSLKMVSLQIGREMCAILMLATVRPKLCGNSDAP